MPGPTAQPEDSLSLDQELRIDAACRGFEAAWKATSSEGCGPRIEDYLTGAGPERVVLLRELVKLDVHYRRGAALSQDEYLGRFPADAPLLGPLLEGLHTPAATPAPERETATGEVSAATSTPGERPDAEAPPDPVNPAVGPLPRVPGYVVLGELGRGGMGIVYRARQLGLKRLVALKMVRAGLQAGDKELARFRAEAEVLARLQHPNIVQIHEVGEADGRPFFALEYVEGGSLADQLDGTPWPAWKAAELVEVLARALDAAHRQDIVHRDTTPANVLLAADGTPKWTDFGLAKRLDADVALTQTEVILGTAPYMPPEVAGGRSKEVGPAADIYGTGAILYELLTGRPPFRAETVLDTLEQVRTEEPVRPGRLNPKVPRDLETICLKCLGKEPSQRYSSAMALAEDLRANLDGRPIRARRTPWYGRTWRWCRRNPAVAALLFVVAGLLATVAVLSTGAAVWLDSAYQQKVKSQREAEKAKDDALTELRKAALAQAGFGRHSDQMGRRFHGLEALREATRRSPDLDLRNEAVACLALVDLRPAAQQPAHLELALYRTTIEPRCERYARADEQGVVVIRSLGTGEELRRLPSSGKGAEPLAWSADGRFLLVGHDQGGHGEFLLWDLVHQKEPLHLKIHAIPGSLAFSPDSRQALVWLGDGFLRLIDADSGQERWRVPRQGRVYGLTFRADGLQVAVSFLGDREVIVYDGATGQLVRRLSHAAGARALAWSPDGRRLAVGCEATGFPIYLWDLERGDARLLEGHQAEVTRLAFNHQGDVLASGSWDGSLRLWNPTSGKPLLTLAGDLVQFSPDGRLLLAMTPGKERLVAYEVAAGHEYRSLSGHDGGKGPWGADISLDGRLMASAGVDGIRLWDFLLGREVARLPCPEARSVLFTPDGKGLIASGSSDVFRWSITTIPDPAAQTRLRIGPRESLGLPGQPGAIRRAALSGDGRVLAVVDRNANEAFRLDMETREWKPLSLHPQYVSFVALSPDGRWAATGPWYAGPVTAWDARTGQAVAALLAVEPAHGILAFSPDGKWLVGGTPLAYLVWEVGSWRLQRELTRSGGTNWAALAFSPDGRVLATVPERGLVRLLDFDSGRELATLTPPDPQLITWLRFTPDGTRLVVATENHAIQVWDLRCLREGLAAIGLDWEMPPYPPAAAAPEPAAMIVEVEGSAP
jgi:WD40 repeat protein